MTEQDASPELIAELAEANARFETAAPGQIWRGPMSASAMTWPLPAPFKTSSSWTSR